MVAERGAHLMAVDNQTALEIMKRHSATVKQRVEVLRVMRRKSQMKVQTRVAQRKAARTNSNNAKPTAFTGEGETEGGPSRA